MNKILNALYHNKLIINNNEVTIIGFSADMKLFFYSFDNKKVKKQMSDYLQPLAAYNGIIFHNEDDLSICVMHEEILNITPDGKASNEFKKLQIMLLEEQQKEYNNKIYKLKQEIQFLEKLKEKSEKKSF